MGRVIYKSLSKACLWVLFAFISVSSVTIAETMSDDLKAEAIEIALQIEREELITDESWIDISLSDDTIEDAERLRLLRQLFMNSLTSVEQVELQNIGQKYQVLATNAGTKRDQAVAELFVRFAKDFNFDNTSISMSRARLEEFVRSDDWFIKNRALMLIAGSMRDLSRADLALGATQEAIRIIPNENTADAVEARVIALEHSVFLHSYLKAPEIMIRDTQRLLAQQKENDLPTDGTAILNNFIYLFSEWQEYETASQIAEILLRLDLNQLTPGLLELRMAIIKNNQGNYSEALTYAQSAAQKATFERLKLGAELNGIVAQAGLGETTKAETNFHTLIEKHDEEKFQTLSLEKLVLQARALIELNKGNKAEYQAYERERQKHITQKLLNGFTQSNANKLVELQNTQDRIAEREAALQRETDLRQKALDNEKETNRLLRILLGVLAFAVVAALAFSRYRELVSRRLEKSAESALAGEKSKSEFLALMSHELRTPLNGIIGLADYLAVQAPSEDVRDKTGVILKSGHDLLALVENILDMTLIEAGELHVYPEQIDIHPIVEKMVNKWNEVVDSKNVKFTWHIDPTVPRKIILDPKRTTQCLDQLLSNAVKFTEKGRIHLHVLGTTSPEETSVQFIVADTGIGISDAAKPRLFKPFVQADTSMTRLYGGAGLGLAITQNLAQMMNGDVIVNSKNGRGSEFVLTLKGEKTVPESLPVEVPTKAVPSLTARKDRAPDMDTVKIPRRILVVEDDVASQNVLRSLLEPAGCNVICVPNGNFALEALKENIFDLVLMDIRMPALNGIETTRKIRALDKVYADIPIIAVTADASPETETRCTAVGMNGYLTKPVSARILFEAFDRLGQKTALKQSA